MAALPLAKPDAIPPVRDSAGRTGSAELLRHPQACPYRSACPDLTSPPSMQETKLVLQCRWRYYWLDSAERGTSSGS